MSKSLVVDEATIISELMSRGLSQPTAAVVCKALCQKWGIAEASAKVENMTMDDIVAEISGRSMEEGKV